MSTKYTTIPVETNPVAHLGVKVNRSPLVPLSENEELELKEALQDSISDKNFLLDKRTAITLRNNIIIRDTLENLGIDTDYDFINNDRELEIEKLPDNIYNYTLKFENPDDDINISFDSNTSKCVIKKSNLTSEIKSTIEKNIQNASINLPTFLNNITDISDFELEVDVSRLKYIQLSPINENKTDAETDKNYHVFSSVGEVYANDIYSNPEDLTITAVSFLGNYSQGEVPYEIVFVNPEHKDIKYFNDVKNLSSFIKVNTAINVFEKITAETGDDNYYDNSTLSKLVSKASKTNSDEFKSSMDDFFTFLERFDDDITKEDVKIYSNIKIQTGDGAKLTSIQTILKKHLENNTNNNKKGQTIK